LRTFEREMGRSCRMDALDRDPRYEGEGKR
jgi:hypothetical protein